MDDLSLVNEKFPFPFAGKDFLVKKANLGQVISFQKFASSKGVVELEMAAHAIFLILNAVDNTVTEQFVLDNATGDMDALKVLGDLGFMSQQKVEQARRIQNSLANRLNPTGGESSGQ